jgi:hypothetical protein
MTGRCAIRLNVKNNAENRAGIFIGKRLKVNWINTEREFGEMVGTKILSLSVSLQTKKH